MLDVLHERGAMGSKRQNFPTYIDQRYGANDQGPPYGGPLARIRILFYQGEVESFRSRRTNILNNVHMSAIVCSRFQ